MLTEVTLIHISLVVQNCLQIVIAGNVLVAAIFCKLALVPCGLSMNLAIHFTLCHETKIKHENGMAKDSALWIDFL